MRKLAGVRKNRVGLEKPMSQQVKDSFAMRAKGTSRRSTKKLLTARLPLSLHHLWHG